MITARLAVSLMQLISAAVQPDCEPGVTMGAYALKYSVVVQTCSAEAAMHS